MMKLACLKRSHWFYFMSVILDFDYAFSFFFLLFSIHVVYCMQMNNTIVLCHLS